jgi:hypothetical protein
MLCGVVYDDDGKLGYVLLRWTMSTLSNDVENLRAAITLPRPRGRNTKAGLKRFIAG